MVGAKLIRISDNVLRSLFDRFNLCRHPETAEQYRNDDKSLFHNGKFYILHHYDALSPKYYYALTPLFYIRPSPLKNRATPPLAAGTSERLAKSPVDFCSEQARSEGVGGVVFQW